MTSPPAGHLTNGKLMVGRGPNAKRREQMVKAQTLLIKKEGRKRGKWKGRERGVVRRKEGSCNKGKNFKPLLVCSGCPFKGLTDTNRWRASLVHSLGIHLNKMR